MAHHVVMCISNNILSHTKSENVFIHLRSNVLNPKYIKELSAILFYKLIAYVTFSFAQFTCTLCMRISLALFVQPCSQGTLSSLPQSRRDGKGTKEILETRLHFFLHISGLKL